jgi:hypothetical protein
VEKVLFKTTIQIPELDEAFTPVQVAVKKAFDAGEMGAVFCQISKNEKDGTYTIGGAFYPREKALIINEALKKAKGA